MAQQKLFELLKRDHRQLEKWMSQMENISEEQREDLFVTLQDALEKHMQLEEKHFYPQIKKITEMKELAQDALSEHEKAQNFLSQLEDTDVEDEDWLPIFQEMREGLQHHIDDEEEKIFPKCNQLMSSQLLEEIGQKCIEEKEGAQRKTTPGRGRKAKK